MVKAITYLQTQQAGVQKEKWHQENRSRYCKSRESDAEGVVSAFKQHISLTGARGLVVTKKSIIIDIYCTTCCGRV